MTEPFDGDAEESVLGSMMLTPKAVETCLDILSGPEFYRPSHSHVFRAIASLYTKGVSVDPITVVEELTTTGLLQEAGGGERIHELNALVPAAGNVKHYAEIVRETWIARNVAAAGGRIQALGLERAENMLAAADEEILAVMNLSERKSDTVFTGKQLMTKLREKIAHPEDELTGVTPPLNAMHHLKPGRLYILAGYMKHGKTAFALQFLRAAAEAGSRVGFSSIEMTKEDLADRLISTFGIPHRQIMTGKLDERYKEAFERAAEIVDGWDFEVIDDPDVSAASLKRAQRRGKYDFLIIDHLHCFPLKDPRHERQEIESNVQQITSIARTANIPVLLLSQLTPGSASDPYPRPSVSSLRGTRAIGMYAATVWYVWRKADEFHNPTCDAELITSLNRFGDTGVVRMDFKPRYVRFDEALSSFA